MRSDARRRQEESREDGAYAFHYHRQERLSRGGVDRDGPAPPKGSIFKRNRSLAIVVIDLLVILLIYGLYILFFAPSNSSATIAGHALTLRAFSFESDAYVTLVFEAGDEARREPVTVTFEAGEETVEVSEVLPEAGTSKNLRAILDGQGEERVTATVTVGDEVISLSDVAENE
jgi:hypothetical protein